MEIEMAYGRSGVKFEIEDTLVSAVYRKKNMPKVGDAEVEISKAMAAPVGAPALHKLAGGKKTACIVINDITRPVPNKLILPFIINELRAAGLADSDMHILNATGTHRPADEAEIIELVGEEIARRHPFHNHYCDRDEEHIHLGKTDSGTEVFIDKRYIEADVKILTGLIEPHFMAGYSGGRKVICPGVASIKSVMSIHHPRFMEAPKATNCVLDDNPLHRELTKIAGMAGCDFIVNVVINEARELCGVYCGDFVAAHAAGVAFACRFDRVESPEKYDVVITSSAGYPLDKTFYQTVKGICGATTIVKPGGTIIVTSECSEGMGNDTFVDGLKLRKRFKSHQEYVKYIEREENFVHDQWQVEKLSQALESARILMYAPALSECAFGLTFTERIKSVEEGVQRGLQIHGPWAKIAVVPEGPYVIPVFKGA